MMVRRFAAVVGKPLIFLMRRSLAAVLRWSAAVLKNPMKSECGGSRRMGWSAPPYPLYAPRRHPGARRGRMEPFRQPYRGLVGSINLTAAGSPSGTPLAISNGKRSPLDTRCPEGIDHD